MHRQLRLPHVHVRRPVVMLTVALAGFATAALVGIAVAKSFTLKKDGNAQVTNQKGVRPRGHRHQRQRVRGLHAERRHGQAPQVHQGQRLLHVLAAGQGVLGEEAQQGPGDQRQARHLASQRLHAGDAERPSALHVRQRQSEGQGDRRGRPGFRWHVARQQDLDAEGRGDHRADLDTATTDHEHCAGDDDDQSAPDDDHVPISVSVAPAAAVARTNSRRGP